MPNLQSELATRVFFVTQKEIWKINVQKDGERKSFYSKLPGKRGQKDCAAKAAAWLLSDSPLSLSDKTTVDDLFELYLKDKALETTDTYNIANRYKNHIAPVIGRIRISRLTKQDLKRVISTAHHEHHLSKKTLLNLRGDLSGFCSYLDDSDIRSDLRTNNIKIPASAPSSDKKALDLISLYILFTHSQVLYNGAVCEDSLIYAYRFNVLTGLRTGEMMGLEWGDIDDDFIHVRRAINAKGVTTGGKNGYAKRDFPQTRQTRAVLKAQEKYRQNPNNPHERVFGDIGQLCYRERWGKFCKYNGIPYVTPYELRHTFKSLYKGEIRGLPDAEKNIPTFQDWTMCMHSWSSDATTSKMFLSSVPAPMFSSRRVVSPRCHALPMVTCAYALGVLCIVMMGSSSSLSKYFAFSARKIFSKYPAVLDVFTVSFIFVSSLSIFSISTHVIPSG